MRLNRQIILFILLVLILFSCCSCDKQQNGARPKGPLVTGNLCAVSFYVNDGNDVSFLMPLIATEEINSISELCFADNNPAIKEYTYDLEEEYKGYYLYSIYLQLDVQTEAVKADTLQMILNGTPVEYRFGRLAGKKTEFDWWTNSDKKGMIFNYVTVEAQEGILTKDDAELGCYCDCELL